MSLSTIRLRPTPPLASAIDAVAKFLIQTPGMEQLGLMPGHDQRTLGKAQGVERRDSVPTDRAARESAAPPRRLPDAPPHAARVPFVPENRSPNQLTDAELAAI